MSFALQIVSHAVTRTTNVSFQWESVVTVEVSAFQSLKHVHWSMRRSVAVTIRRMEMDAELPLRVFRPRTLDPANSIDRVIT